MKAPQCYVICTLPVFGFIYYPQLHEGISVRMVKIHCLREMAILIMGLGWVVFENVNKYSIGTFTVTGS
jgi:hypothetical protein